MHDVLYTDGCYYITDCDSFIASKPTVQLAASLSTALLALTFAQLSRGLVAFQGRRRLGFP